MTSAKRIAAVISEGLKEQGFEVDEVDAWPVSDCYLAVASPRSDYAGFFRVTEKGEVFAIEERQDDIRKAVLAAFKKMGLRVRKDHKRTIFVAYEIVTPESAEYNDAAERGEEDEEEIVPSYDETFVSAAVKYLKDSGAHSADGTDWFETGFEVTDYKTGEEENHTFHLRGFTDEEEALIHAEMKRKRR